MSSRRKISTSANAQTKARGRKSIHRKKLSQNLVPTTAGLLQSTNDTIVAPAALARITPSG
jgi:hypothetical protein